MQQEIGGQLDGGGVDDHLQHVLVLVPDHSGGDAGGEDAGLGGAEPLPSGLEDPVETPLEPAGERVGHLGACLPHPVVEDHPDCLSGIGEAGMEVAEAARDGGQDH